MEARGSQRELLKRVFDLVAASAMTLALLPVACLIALVIKAERRGPVFFRQERLGRGRRPFQILKFRTMDVDAERRTGPVWALERDPRATPVGRFLRASHLDELPQLWNVLRGEMSLVGPRPERGHFVAQFESLIPFYGERFAARPGITGLSQIRSGYDQSIRTVRRKVRYDRFYIRRACFLFDLWLLVGTAGHVMAATASSSIQASPGSPLPQNGSGAASPPTTPQAATRTVFPWPGGAAALASAGLDSELVLSAERQPGGGEFSGYGSPVGRTPDSLSASGQSDGRKGERPHGPGPSPVPEPASVLLVGSVAAWLLRRGGPSAT